ncbi:uncharacterized protein [Lolium perenne]|uniref:uncharacterized protein n=1 Tax=Lolium perenne TaxID=4522 RepID=UPI0021F53010|nr:uncharacterized protein LOC127326999 [Lolium perenne]
MCMPEVSIVYEDNRERLIKGSLWYTIFSVKDLIGLTELKQRRQGMYREQRQQKKIDMLVQWNHKEPTKNDQGLFRAAKIRWSRSSFCCLSEYVWLALKLIVIAAVGLPRTYARS